MENHTPRKLYRSDTDRIIAGVCGGLAEYLTIDANVIRLIFIIMAFMGGSGIFIYIILAFLIPVRGETHTSDGERMREFVEKASDTIKNAAEGIKNNIQDQTWYKEREARRHNRRNFLGILLIIFGIVFLVQQVVPMPWLVIRWDILWPALLILLGIYFISRSK